MDDRGCWEWRGSRHHQGYGMFMEAHKKPVKAHRLSWRLHNGEIPASLCVLHRCDNTGCVNPAHLFLGTQLDNIRDMVSKGRNRCPNAEMTHCSYGHFYGGSNLRITPQGRRDCKECCKRRQAQIRARKRALK
jgi:hypothetical protein